MKNRLLWPYGWVKSQVQRLQKPQAIDFPIDFVVTWVDGSDPEWQNSRALYLNDMSREGNPESRYRDWGWLKYWFRAVEQYAPWVHKVYFVTCGQKPDWLNLQHEKLVFVSHQDFIPAEYLPTFNSHTIELNLWRIPGLSEHFVYYNDDMFLISDTQPDDFYRDGLPREMAVAYSLTNDQKNDSFSHMLLTMTGLINGFFDKKQVQRTNWKKWFNPIYGKKAVNTVMTAYSHRFFRYSDPASAKLHAQIDL